MPQEANGAWRFEEPFKAIALAITGMACSLQTVALEAAKYLKALTKRLEREAPQ